MIEISYEFWCYKCETSEVNDEPKKRCDKCGNTDVFNGRVGRCSCGELVTLGSFTNECDNCGRLYNNFGQSLRPASEWEEDW